MIFSLIVGTYNHKQTLPRLLKSLKMQTYKDFEVIFCDDGSTDGTYEMLRKQGQRVFRQRHRGMRLAKSLNRGLKAAKGDYILLVMGDSFLESDYLEILKGWVRPERLICGVRWQVDGDRVVDMDWRIKKELVPNQPALLGGRPWVMTTGNGLCIPRKAFLEQGYLDEKFRGYGGEDQEIVMRLCRKGYTAWSIPDLKLYHNYHRSRSSLMRNNKRLQYLEELPYA